MAHKLDIAGMTASHVLELVDTKQATPAQAAAALKARMDAQVAAGKRPRYASRQAYEELSGKAYEFDTAKAQTRKQRKAAAAESKPAPKAQAKKAPAKRTRKAAAKPTVDALVAELAKATKGADADVVLAAFTKAVEALVKS